MRNRCGKSVNRTWYIVRKKCARTCGRYIQQLSIIFNEVHKPLFYPVLCELQPQSYTQQKSIVSPLFVYIFYPVSTVPITTTTIFQKEN